MRTIARLLESRRAAIIGAAMAGTNWERNAAFLQALDRCDVILVNGEGTLHHGHPRAEKLLRVVDHPLRAAKPVCIVNALYQGNPPAWSRYLAKVRLIIARDGRSHRELAGVYGGRLFRALDLSLHEPYAAPAGIRHGITIGDSVCPVVTAQLLRLAAADGTTFLPIMRTLKSRKARLPAGIRLLRDAYIRLHARACQMMHRHVRFVNDEWRYLDLVGRSQLHLTGRFHGACLSVVVNVPFLAVASNSWKIEALIEDLGLETHRLATTESMRRQLDGDPAAGFTAQEEANMKHALESSRRTINDAFDEIVAAAA